MALLVAIRESHPTKVIHANRETDLMRLLGIALKDQEEKDTDTLVPP